MSSALAQTELRRETLRLTEKLGKRNRTALLSLLLGGTIALTKFILLLRYFKILRVAMF